MEKFLENLGIIIFVGIGVCLLISIILFPIVTYKAFDCYQRLKYSGHEDKYRIFSGCLVKTNDGFIPIENWRVVQ